MTYNLNTEIDNVKTEYKAWRRINKSQKEALYDLLAKNLTIIENIKTDYDFAKIDDRLENANIKVKKNSSIELKVIRLIMTSERKKASSYSIVLKTARKAGITSDKFSQWLTLQGGIEKVRQANTTHPQSEDIQKQFTAGKKIALSKKSLATVKLDIPYTQKNDLVLLVARVGDNGQVDIVDVAGAGEKNKLVTKSISTVFNSNSHKTQEAGTINLGQKSLLSLASATAASRAKGRQENA